MTTRFNVMFTDGYSTHPIAKDMKLQDAIRVLKDFLFSNYKVWMIPCIDNYSGEAFVLHGFGNKKIFAIKEMRCALGIGLKEAKDLVEQDLPYRIDRESLVRDQALGDVYTRLRKAGCDVRWLD